MLDPLLDDVREDSAISPSKLARMLHWQLKDVARFARVSRDILRKNPSSPKVQGPLGAAVRVLNKAENLTQNRHAAIFWFNHQSIPAFGDKTARELVEEGHAEAVLRHLDDLAHGGHA